MANEAADAVSKQPVGLAMHLIATASLCANGASDAERELAKRLLLEEPNAGLHVPREAETIAATFNRHMDAAIESCNDSAREATRSVRRARLASDLGRAGLVLMDRAELALLLDRGAPVRPVLLDAEPCCLETPRSTPNCPCAAEIAAAGGSGRWGSLEHDGHDLGSELLEGEQVYGVVPGFRRGARPALREIKIELAATPATVSGATSSGILGLEFQEGTTFVTHTPSFDVSSSASSAYDGDTNVND